MGGSERPAAWGVIVRRYGMILDRRAIGSDTVTIGRDTACDIVLDDPGVSRRAARLGIEGGDLVVRDLGSLAGIKVDDEVVSERRLLPGEVIEVGPFTIEVSGDAEVASAAARTVSFEPDDTSISGARAGAGPPATLLLPDGTSRVLYVGGYTLGRSDDCEVRVVGDSVSKKHAELRVAYGSVRVVDLGSTNGTSFDGEEVTDRVVEQGGRLQLGDESIELVISEASPPVKERPSEAAPEDPEETIRIDRPSARNVDDAPPADGSDERGGKSATAPAKQRPRDRAGGRQSGGEGMPASSAPVRGEDAPATDAAGGGGRRRLLLLALLIVAVIIVVLVIASESSGDPVAAADGPRAPSTEHGPSRGLR